MRTLMLFAVLSLLALPARALEEVNGFLTVEDAAVWLTARPPESAARADRVRIVEGPYVRTPLSIAREYGTENRVILRGARDASGALAIHDCEPAFVPYIPDPEHVVRASLTGDRLEIVVRVNPCIPREKLRVKCSPYQDTLPRQATVWIEAPDRHQDVCSGDEVEHTFTVDLRAHYPPTPFQIYVRSSRCEPVRTFSWNR